MTSSALASLARRATDLGDPLPCADDTALWFSEVPADLELAKAMCEMCPLRLPCLAGAIERREPFGVWGGEIFEKGRVIAYKRPRGHPGRHARTG
jgi:WhiB family transcriptional regulator, redox-sensing transcriptional regulator